MSKHHHVQIIGYPSDLGAGRRGVDMGPSALRIAGITRKLETLGYTVTDEGDIPVHALEIEEEGSSNLKFLTEIARATTILAERVESALDANRFPLILGGDHSMGIGSLGGVAAHCKREGKRLGVVWIDAHADMNTPETTPSGNIHGMPLAVAMGLGHPKLKAIGGDFVKVQPENVVIIAARDLDVGEVELIKRLNLSAYTMFDIDKRGIYPIIAEVVEKLRPQVDHLHVSFDLDSVDPLVAPGVGTPVPGGLSFREAHFVMEYLAETQMVGSLDVTEVNPILDTRNSTAVFATEVVSSCMGKRIL
ncbi:MAG: arginase [Ignavibacteria bacterium]|nr:arginase [Ignavibacteria bacterium]MBL7991605.1 arginase [Candidatus Kapabacteria bacterium]